MRYKKKDDLDDLFQIYIYSPDFGHNKYNNTLLDKDPKTKTLYMLREEGNFQDRISGDKSLYLSGAFIFTRNPFAKMKQSADLTIKPRMAYSPSAVEFDGKLYCFHQGTDLKLYYTVYQGEENGVWKWSDGTAVDPDNTRLNQSPATVVFHDKLYVSNNGHDVASTRGFPFDCLWYNTMRKDGSWEGKQQVPDTRLSNHPAVIEYEDKIMVVFQGYGKDGSMWQNTFDANGNWSGSTRIQGIACSESPALVKLNGKLWCYYQESDDRGALWQVQYVDHNWVAPGKVNKVGISASPSVIALKDLNQLWVFHQGFNQNLLWCKVYDFGRQTWYEDVQFMDVEARRSPCAVEYQGKIWVFHQSGRDQQELVLKTITLPR